MTTTEDIGTGTPESEESTNESLGEWVERLMAEVENRTRHLMDELHHAARGSEAFEGGERDARRLMDWLGAKAQEMRSELDQLGKDAGDLAEKMKERVSRKPDAEEPTASTTSPEEPPNPDDD